MRGGVWVNVGPLAGYSGDGVPRGVCFSGRRMRGGVGGWSR